MVNEQAVEDLFGRDRHSPRAERCLDESEGVKHVERDRCAKVLEDGRQRLSVSVHEMSTLTAEDAHWLEMEISVQEAEELVDIQVARPDQRHVCTQMWPMESPDRRVNSMEPPSKVSRLLQCGAASRSAGACWGTSWALQE